MDITVLSQDPAQTSAKFAVKSARRMSLRVLGPGPGQQQVLQVVAEEHLHGGNGDGGLVAGAGNIVVACAADHPA